MQHPIAFALDSRARLVDVYSVPQGLACGCVCAGCGDRLLAKQGQVRAWYFSHLSGAECRGGAETALHLAAKQLILEHRSVALPPLVVNFSRQHPKFGLFERSKSIDLPEKIWRMSDARAESSIGTYIADIAGTLDDRTEVVVEVKVHHEVEPEKAEYLRDNLVPCVEIDLFPLLEESVNLQKLAWHVLECTTNRRWVSNSGYAALKAQLLAEYNAWVAEKSKNAPDLPCRQYEVKKQPPSKVGEANARYRAKPDDMKRLELRMVLGLTGDNVWPRHLEVLVREGATAIPAPLDIWQGETFAQFIYDPTGQRQDTKRFSLPQVYEWFSGRFGTSELVRFQVSAALRLFLGYLTSCGFLERHGDAFTVLHGALRPPSRPKSRVRPATSPETPPVVTRPKPIVVRRSWTWRELWPFEDVAVARAAEAIGRFAGTAFNAERFVRSLYDMSVEPSEAAVKRLVAECEGNADAAFDLLKYIGVVEESWRMLRVGVEPPWRRA
ncbi:Competence protein CoiA-like family [Paraburkholderia caribensis MBA4]|uniref:Competence protein CoiA-like family n=1 Tax=Paraburkholderia caribensis MBA4 TaxID=1323664 RepID=A0A0P0RHH9_9BURK|nr:competence protein CoiA family protein [Paraburkholderia caribensis]ALL68247.1 Competence protein CoiA-like family [Paraburkholderia caribensis MBA4]